MADEKITPIRADLAPPTLPPDGPPIQVIEERAEEIRELIFQAMAILNVAAAAARSEVPADGWSTQNTLKAAAKLLDDAAGQLEPGVITDKAEVAHGQVQ
jgi:hypothetical protein